MAHLYPHTRIHQVFGANTDVGKTIFTTALCLASAALPLDPSSAFPNNNNSVIESARKQLGERVHYLKPVSTGNLNDSDDAHVSRYAPATQYNTLYRFGEPVSPHLAVQLDRKKAQFNSQTLSSSSSPPSPQSVLNPTDQEFVIHVGDWIHRAAATTQQATRAAVYVETAGGVHSPGPSGTSQAHLLRPLRLPTILIGSSELGGISTTRSAYESLMMNGYQVDAVLLFPSPRYGNVEYLKKMFEQEHGIPVFGLGGPVLGSPQQWGSPPLKNVDTKADQQAMMHFYEGLVRGQDSTTNEQDAGGVFQVVRYLRQKHLDRLYQLSTLASRTRETCWWPFTQHTLTQSDRDVNVIDSAYGDFFSALDQRPAEGDPLQPKSLLQPLLDGSASWWTQCLGHAPNRLVQAAARAGARYGHVLFPNGANEPALHLAEQLTGKVQGRSDSSVSLEKLDRHPGAGWASRVFFSDDGSTGMEVAIKMAIQSSILRYSVDRPSNEKAANRLQKGRKAGYQSGRPEREWQVLGIKGSYHGDTIGAMDACEPSVYSKAVHWYRGRGFWFDPPVVQIEQGKVTITVSQPEEGGTFPLDLVPESIRNSQQQRNTPFVQTFDSIQDAYDVTKRLKTDPLTQLYRKSIRSMLEKLVIEQGRRFGALVLEPLVMGAAGMIFVDPLFQRMLVDVVRESEDLFSLTDPPLRWSRTPMFHESRPSSTEQGHDATEWQGLPVVFDEVFTGLYRLGHATPASVLGVTPDISCLAKILTGGMVPMSVTLASQSIFKTFSQSDSKVDALLHGHSYTAHPIGCEVALETLKTIETFKQPGQRFQQAQQNWNHQEEKQEETSHHPRIWSFWSRQIVEKLSQLENVDHAMAMGCVLKVSVKDQNGGGGYTSTASIDILKKLRYQPCTVQGHPSIPISTSQDATLPFNIHARPLGNVIYLMSSLNTPQEVLQSAEQILFNAIEEQVPVEKGKDV